MCKVSFIIVTVVACSKRKRSGFKVFIIFTSSQDNKQPTTGTRTINIATFVCHCYNVLSCPTEHQTLAYESGNIYSRVKATVKQVWMN